MLQRAIDTGVPFAWATADEAYGQAKHTRFWLEQRGVGYVLAASVNDTVITTGRRKVRVDELVAALPWQAWKRLSVASGTAQRFLSAFSGHRPTSGPDAIT
jgi:hypothetical protein